jgi:hypothetical protein
MRLMRSTLSRSHAGHGGGAIHKLLVYGLPL